MGKTATRRPSAERVFAALDTETWRTPGNVATYLNMGYSSATEQLRWLLQVGMVERRKLDAIDKGYTYRAVLGAAWPPVLAKKTRAKAAPPREVPVKVVDTGLASPGTPKASQSPARAREVGPPAGPSPDNSAGGVDAPASHLTSRVAAMAPVTDPGQRYVWIAIRRRGIDYHHLDPADADAVITSLDRIGELTRCGRSTHHGEVIDLGVTGAIGELERLEATPCPRCFPPAEEERCPDCGEPLALIASGSVGHVPGEACDPAFWGPEWPGEACDPDPSGWCHDTRPDEEAVVEEPEPGSAGAVLEYMRQARPLPPAPEPQPARRSRAPRADRPAYATWGRGELQAAILAHLQGLPEGEAITPHHLAVALNSHGGAVAYGLVQLTDRGVALLVGTDPKRYAAA